MSTTKVLIVFRNNTRFDLYTSEEIARDIYECFARQEPTVRLIDENNCRTVIASDMIKYISVFPGSKS